MMLLSLPMLLPLSSLLLLLLLLLPLTAAAADPCSEQRWRNHDATRPHANGHAKIECGCCNYKQRTNSSPEVAAAKGACSVQRANSPPLADAAAAVMLLLLLLLLNLLLPPLTPTH